MKPKAAIIIAFLVAATAIVLVTVRSKKGDDDKKPQVTSTEPGAQVAPGVTRPGAAVEIGVLYSTEKKEWLEAAAAEFQKAHPEITVKLEGKGSFEAAADILDGKAKPTVWSPADSMVLNLLVADWDTKYHTPLFAASGDDAPQPLLLTPLVFVVWQDRAEALLKGAPGGTISWKVIAKAVTSNQGWSAIGGQAKWGFVKLGHTDPTRSNSGLQALYLMSLEFFGKPRLEIEDITKADYQEFVRGIEKGVSKFEASTGTFMTDMVRFGPSKYDIAMVYEALAIKDIDNAQGRWGSLKVYYPATTVWSDHPMGVLQAEWVTEAQKAAGRQFVAFLRSRPMQERALQYGYRPADTSVPIKTADAQNPFTRLAQHGISIEVPTAAEPPDAMVVRTLMQMWQRVVPAR
jgi:ABC-type molybdate transport system substrate-binding protein